MLNTAEVNLFREKTPLTLELHTVSTEKGPSKGSYDVIIAGAGIAGLTAALYSARYGMKTLVVYKDFGKTATAGIIEDYPGIISTTGEELSNRLLKQVSAYKVPMSLEILEDVKRSFEEEFKVITSNGEYNARTVILAVGAERRKLGVPGETEFLGKGVSYCAVCDAPLFKGKTVVVVGGGDTAVKEAMHLAYYARKVYIVHRRNQLKAMPIMLEKLEDYSNIELILSRRVVGIFGQEVVKGVILDNGEKLAVDGVFVSIGLRPPVELFKRIGLKVDEKGYVVVNSAQMTSIKGIFAAGDCTNACNKFHQLVTAAAQGAVAADSAYKLILEKYGKTLLSKGTYR